MSSFLKYLEQETEPGAAPISFRRAREDGMPFRGNAPLLKQEEYEELTETTCDGNVDVFDLSDPEQKARLQKIVDRTANGWYVISKLEEQFVPQPDGTIKVYVYCVWVVPFKEIDANRLKSL